MSERFSLRQQVGVLLLDLPGFLWIIRHSGKRKDGRSRWISICNRNERLVVGRDGLGARCDWQWTSCLYAPRVFPRLGRLLMKKSLADWPVVLDGEPARRRDRVEVSFIIGHRGLARLPHLLFTLQSIAAQQGVEYECVVVEQAAAQEIKEFLPAWVRYLHTPLPDRGLPYCRSWAFNAGARRARGRLLVLHDNDMLVPHDYGRQLWERYREGYDVVNVKRFIFYLSEQHTSRLISRRKVLVDEPPERIVQNLEAGGSVAVGRDAYFAIGGYDEAFIGWGGEDNEFWERARTLAVWPYGYLPIVHLWHTPQAGKKSRQDNANLSLYEERRKVAPEERIARLRRINIGAVSGPAQQTR